MRASTDLVLVLGLGLGLAIVIGIVLDTKQQGKHAASGAFRFDACRKPAIRPDESEHDDDCESEHESEPVHEALSNDADDVRRSLANGPTAMATEVPHARPQIPFSSNVVSVSMGDAAVHQP